MTRAEELNTPYDTNISIIIDEMIKNGTLPRCEVAKPKKRRVIKGILKPNPIVKEKTKKK